MIKFYEKDIWRTVLSAVACVLLLYSSIQTARIAYNRRLVSQYRTELGQFREQLDYLTKQQSRVKELTGAAVDYCNANEQYLTTSVSTVRELQAQIHLLEDYCYSLRDYVMCIRSNINDSKNE